MDLNCSEAPHGQGTGLEFLVTMPRYVALENAHRFSDSVAILVTTRVRQESEG